MDALGTQLAATQAAQQAGTGGTPGSVPSPDSPAQATATATQLGPVATATPIVSTATALAPAPTAVGAACASPFTVRQGDWIYKIARECRLDPKAIIAANPGINANRLTPGQRINLPGAAVTPVPGASATPAPSACTGTYTVRAGDNLFRIAFRCGLTTEQMARRNNVPAPYIIYPGQVLTYP
jgi:LysM repeat protein